MGVVEAVNGNIKSLLRRGRGYKNPGYLLLKDQRITATRMEFAASRKGAQNAALHEFLCRPEIQSTVVSIGLKGDLDMSSRAVHIALAVERHDCDRALAAKERN
jgi:hypothetical protein